MIYNQREKIFPDGLAQFSFYSRLLHCGDKRTPGNKGGPDAHGSGNTIEMKEIENMKRAKRTVWDLARANDCFTHWVTLTFSPEMVVDRYDYKCCAEGLGKFTRYLRDHDGSWLLVPDTHEDGAIHFHGLMAADIEFVRAVNPYTGEDLFDKSGRPVYNISGYKLGFTSAVPLDGCYEAVVNYLTAYYTKNRKMIVPKGCKRYWASRNLLRPMVCRSLTTQEYFLQERVANARYVTSGEARFFNYMMAEVQTDGFWSEQPADDLPKEWREKASIGPTQQNKKVP